MTSNDEEDDMGNVPDDDPVMYEEDTDLEADTTIRSYTPPSWVGASAEPVLSFSHSSYPSGTDHQMITSQIFPLPLNDRQQPSVSNMPPSNPSHALEPLRIPT